MKRTGDSAKWRKSSASVDANCVEVAFLETSVLVRDSKNVGGPYLTFSIEEWTAFLRGVTNGEFKVRGPAG